MKHQKSNLIVKPLFNKFKLITLSLLLISTTLHANFAGGDGTENNPYQISTIAQLNQVRDFNDQNFILINDLDFLGTPYDSANSVKHKGWEPIVDFSGIFDGDGFVISNLYIMRPIEDDVGLFAYNSGTVINLGLENVKVNGQKSVGGITGENYGFIESSYVYGIVNGSTNVGGIIGLNYGLFTSRNHSNGSVNGYKYVGGIAGYNESVITSSYSNSSVHGFEHIGGIAGFSGTIDSSFYDIDQACIDAVVARSQIDYSYSTGNISGHNYVGGIAGSASGLIRVSYSNNNVEILTNDSILEEDRKVGPFLGYDYCNYKWFEYNYYNKDKDYSFPLINYHMGLPVDSIGIQDSFRYKLEYKDSSGFSYNPNGFPYLKWQDPDNLPLSIKKQSKQSSLNLKFNFQNNTLNIYFDEAQHLTVSIYSLTGELVISKSYNSTQIKQDLNLLNSSMYIVKVLSSNGTYTDKILVK